MCVFSHKSFYSITKFSPNETIKYFHALLLPLKLLNKVAVLTIVCSGRLVWEMSSHDMLFMGSFFQNLCEQKQSWVCESRVCLLYNISISLVLVHEYASSA